MVMEFGFFAKVELAVMSGSRPNENKWLNDLDTIRELWNTKDEAHFKSEGNRLIKEYERVEDE